MSQGLRFRRSQVLALVGALACGALTAALATGAGPEPRLITLKNGPERLVILKASDGGDLVRVAGTAPGNLTFGGDRQYTSQRTDCDVVGPVMTNAVCTSPNLETIEMSLGDGKDELKVEGDYTSSGVRIVARGGPRDDRLRGSDARDDLDGDGGRDELLGRGGNDHLDGGADDDDCNGGPGQDSIRNCED